MIFHFDNENILHSFSKDLPRYWNGDTAKNSFFIHQRDVDGKIRFLNEDRSHQVDRPISVQITAFPRSPLPKSPEGSQLESV